MLTYLCIHTCASCAVYTGGSPEDIFGFMHDVGLPDESCNNYAAVTTPTCDAESMCINCMVIDEQGTKQCWPVEKYTT